MTSLNSKALRRLARFCLTCGIFRTKEIEASDEFYHGEEHILNLLNVKTQPETELPEVDRREVETMALPLDEIETSPSLGGGDSPRCDESGKDNNKVPADKKSSTLSLRRLMSRAFSKKNRKANKGEIGDNIEKSVEGAEIGEKSEIVLEFGQMLLDLSPEDFLRVKPRDGWKKVKPEVGEKKYIFLEFGQMLLDLSVEDFLKVKSKNGVAAPFIVITPPLEDDERPFVV